MQPRPRPCSLQLTSQSLLPAMLASIRLGEITPCGAYVVVVWMCGVAAAAAREASCAITSITIFMTLSRVSRPTDREESERGAAKAQSHKTRPSVARCSPSSASERERTQPKIGLHLRVRFEATL